MSINQHQDSHCRNFIQQREILYLDFAQVSVVQDSKWYKQCAKVYRCMREWENVMLHKR